MKKPASAMHFTLVVAGRRARNLSQCNIEANPPAEQPERIAYDKQINVIKQGLTFCVQKTKTRALHFSQLPFLLLIDH